MVRSKPDGGLQEVAEETGGGYFELQEDERPRADLHEGRAGASQSVRDWLHAHTARQPRAQLMVKMKQPGMTARARRSYLAAPDSFTVGEK
jgi:hypothetical protein